MKLRHVSIMVDVPESVYDDVVEPLKRQKKFTKVIKNLLAGMKTDPYIQNVAEGSVERLDASNLQRYREENSKNISDIIDEILVSTDIIGMAAEESQSLARGGVEAVDLGNVNNSFGEDVASASYGKNAGSPMLLSMQGMTVNEKPAKPSVNDSAMGAVPESNKSVEDLIVSTVNEKFSVLSKQVNSRVGSLENSMNDFMKNQTEVLNLLMQKMSTPVVSPEVKKEPVIPEVAPEEPVTVPNVKVEAPAVEEVASTQEVIKQEETVPQFSPEYVEGADDGLGDDISFGDENAEINLFDDEEDENFSDEDFLDDLVEGQEYSF